MKIGHKIQREKIRNLRDTNLFSKEERRILITKESKLEGLINFLNLSAPLSAPLALLVPASITGYLTYTATNSLSNTFIASFTTACMSGLGLVYLSFGKHTKINDYHSEVRYFVKIKDDKFKNSKLTNEDLIKRWP